MAKYSKTFKIGEVCQGGVITVEITGKVINVIAKEWDFSAGSTRGSSQKNAKEFRRATIVSTDINAEDKLFDYLCELSTSYWSDEIMKWIKSKVQLG